MTLPNPSAEEKELSDALTQHLKNRAEHQPYWFCDFMSDVLYTPGLGYYRNSRPKFGKSGDFITAPMISPLFGKTIGVEIHQLLTHLPQKNILEFGAGLGHLCADILSSIGFYVERYYILEISPVLIAAQKETIQKICPEWAHKVIWLDALPKHFIGVALANEVLDAMPVHRFRTSETIEAQAVLWDGAQWKSEWRPAPSSLKKAVEKLQIQLGFPLDDGYVSEYNAWAEPWIHALSDCMTEGAVILIDYGFVQSDFYNGSRSEGTLMCHYKHHAHADPFSFVGLQDITAHVDFSLIAHAALDSGFQVLGYCNQMAFLMSAGILQQAEKASITPGISQALHTLLSPSEMGELFKVMILKKSNRVSSRGFSVHNDLIKL